MGRTFALALPVLMLAGCAAAAARPAPASVPSRPPPTTVRSAEQSVLLEMPHGWWLMDGDGDDSVLTIVHERRRVAVTVRSRSLDASGFIATVEFVRRLAIDAGCELRRGSARYVTDQFGRRAVTAARRTSEGDIQDGEITVLELEGRPGVLVIEAWWPETPSTWMLDDVHRIVDSVRVLR